jgi:hypothetical protein
MDIESSRVLEVVAAAIFALALLHTFSTKQFEHLAHVHPRHAGLMHLFGEVEVVFGFWAMVLLLFMAVHLSTKEALAYLESRNFTEPAFVLVIMVIAASKPVLDIAAATLQYVSRIFPIKEPIAYYATILSIGPLLGSFITEPAAMTLSALLLRERFMNRNAPASFMYATIGVLFVNVSIGGTLTPFAAPPVLMVAERWGWDIGFMLSTFGWKSAIAVGVNALGVAFVFRSYLAKQREAPAGLPTLETPIFVIAIHLAFLIGVVVFHRHPLVFGALFLFFLGYCDAYKRHQSKLMLREGLMVAFFLAGLVVIGGMQRWWLQPLLAAMDANTLFVGSTLLTAIVDNAALTYLGSLVDGIADELKYSLVAGAVTGGGLTVIANAPNPAGFALLKNSFEEGAISAVGLVAAATIPTLIAAAAFMFLPG